MSRVSDDPFQGLATGPEVTGRAAIPAIVVLLLVVAGVVVFVV